MKHALKNLNIRKFNGETVQKLTFIMGVSVFILIFFNNPCFSRINNDCPYSSTVTCRVEGMVELNYHTNEKFARIIFNVDGYVPDDMIARAKIIISSKDDLEQEKLISSSQTIIEIDMDEVPLGEHIVLLSVTRGKDIIWKNTDNLIRRASPSPGTRITQIDSNRQIMLVDGEPFFPIGVFGVNKENLSTIKDIGFNLTMRWKPNTRTPAYNPELPLDSANNIKAVNDYLDAVNEAGLYIFEAPVKLSPVYVNYRDTKWDEKWPFVNNQVLPGVLNIAQDHPAVIGYYNYDEPDNFYPNDPPDSPRRLLQQEGVEDAYNKMRELDPYHPVLTLFAVGLTKVEDWEASDIVARDFYPSESTHLSLSYRVFKQFADTANKLNYPFIATPLFEKSDGRGKPMNGEEQRAQTYLALIAGAKGIFWWEWTAAYKNNWESVKQLVHEMNVLKPILLEKTPSFSVKYTDGTELDLINTTKPPEGMSKTIITLVKKFDGKTYLIAANAENASVEATFILPGSYSRMANSMFENTEIEIINGEFTDNFEAYGRRIYEIDIDWPANGTLLIDTKVGDIQLAHDPVFPVNTKNFIVNSSFEEGYGSAPEWPYGWSTIESILDPGVVGAPESRWSMDETTSVHGGRSMRLVKTVPGIPENSWFVWYEGHAPCLHQGISGLDPGQYTASAYLKADLPSKVWLMVGWGLLKEIDVSTEWQRYSMTVDKVSTGTFIRIYIVSEGTLWVDAVQFEKGSSATDYEYHEPLTGKQQ